MGDHEVTLGIEYDDFSMRAKLNLKRFGGTFGRLRFDRNPFLKFYKDSHLIGIISLLMRSMLIAQVPTLVIKI